MANALLICTTALIATMATSTVAAQTQPSPGRLAQPVSYGRDIRPMLSDRCFRCHGPDEATRAADLRLDVRADALADREGAAAIVPGNPDLSLLMQRIRSHDDNERMPPPKSKKPALQANEIAKFEQWILAGATYEQHWAFVQPVQCDVPSVAAQSAIDSFLQRARQRAGLTANAPASRATLMRRLFLVLTGLPPTPTELREWLADDRPDAYERLVDRILTAEPYATRHAEHLAGIWLDAGRYADTSGIHMDAGRQAWLWRDWLIAAIRADKPFDDFVVEQLAGDLLPNATASQRVATGFLRNHVTTDEGGAINAEYLVEYAAERTATVGSVFLGLTVGCARCHDHKYDPIRQQDYYRLFSFFNNNEEPGLYSQSKNANRALEPKLSVPSDAQLQRSNSLNEQIASATAELDELAPTEEQSYREFLHQTGGQMDLHWTRPQVLSATSLGGAKLTRLADGSVLGSGANPDKDRHVYALLTHATNQRWLCLEALPDASLPQGKLSRAAHGNAVLQYLRCEVRAWQPDRAADDADAWQEVPLRYALADVEQQNGDFGIGNALVDNGIGWAVAGHKVPGPRTAWFLADRAFGFAGGTELRITLAYDSGYTKHVLGRLRFATSRASLAVLADLPLATTGYYTCGPFVPGEQATQKQAAPTAALAPGDLYAAAFGPEHATTIDGAERFGKRRWRYRDKLARNQRHALSSGQNVSYVGQRLWAPNQRVVEVALGSDDGFQLFLDGTKVGERRVNRGVALDQDRVRLTLTPGAHLLVLKVINTGGAGGFALRHVPGAHELHGDLSLALVPDVLGSPVRGKRLLHAYRIHRSPVYQQRSLDLKALREQLKTVADQVPQAMVMQERATARATFVLTRGEYDKADKRRPVVRELPQMFGPLPADLPKNRLGLARWLVSTDNPLLGRVTVNRLWQFVFGTGIVRTSEDFGHQGAWPSHPELLDWLACEFRQQGLSVRAMLRLMVTSDAFRQQSRVPVASEYAKDPDNRLLSWFARRRLSAEAIRDQALYVAGLLVEQVGGPSVKPYQPSGLWREVAMLQSNTRTFVADAGNALFRRSLYTYWKRACPPPALLTFDAPTREFCTIRRSITNTPLQALVLWNDEQFVEAARMLATRTLHEQPDHARQLALMYRRATGRQLRGQQATMATATLRDLIRRYQETPTDAARLLAIGQTPNDTSLNQSRLAAFTMLASAFLDLDATLYVD